MPRAVRMHKAAQASTVPIVAVQSGATVVVAFLCLLTGDAHSLSYTSDFITLIEVDVSFQYYSSGLGGNQGK